MGSVERLGWKPAVVFALLLSVGALGLSGCNTAEGFGQDMENLGDSIEDEASD